MPRNPGALQACYHCRKTLFNGKGVPHWYAKEYEAHKVHKVCHEWLLKRERTLQAAQAPEPIKEVTLSDVERDALALWLQDVPQDEIAMIMSRPEAIRTRSSIIGAINRCQEKFNAANREQLRERALAGGYGVVNQEHIA